MSTVVGNCAELIVRRRRRGLERLLVWRSKDVIDIDPLNAREEIKAWRQAAPTGPDHALSRDETVLAEDEEA